MPHGRVTNYDQCVQAGYPIGRLGNQERCWTPNLEDVFVKGLKPTIQQGVYGTLVLRTGNCMPRGSHIPNNDPCQYKPVDRHLYVFAYVSESPLLGLSGQPKELVLKAYKPIKSAETNNAVYEIALPAGSYLVFADEEGELWRTGFALVEPGERTEEQLMINKAFD